MTTQQLPNLHHDITFSRMADAFAKDQRTIQVAEKLKERFVDAFFHGALKGIKAGYASYCKERGSFDYVTPDVDNRYANVLSRLYSDKYATDTIKRVYNGAQIGFLDDALHHLFIEGAQYGLTKGYEMGEQGNKKER